MTAFLASIHAVMRQDRYDRQLYGASVVDAYTDLENIRRFVQRRMSYLSWTGQVAMTYKVLRIADRGGDGG